MGAPIRQHLSMSEVGQSFSEWQMRAQEDPGHLADHFLGKLDLLPPESQRAFIASHPDRDTMIREIKAACADPEVPLAGVPYMLQDMFDVAGLPTRCGAPFQDPFEPPLEDASLLYQKLKSIGAALIAKTVPSEFGIDMRGRNPSFGDCPHADSVRFVAGGGAGSCAYAVKNGWVPIAFGLDSCAGVRIPAAFHGLFGFRMGNNAYAREGVFPIVPSCDSVGWMTGYPEDLAKSIEAFYPKPKLAEKTEPLSGYLLHDPTIPLDPDVKAGMMDLVRHLSLEEHPDINKALCQDFKPSGQAFNTIQARELYSLHEYWIEEYRSKYEPDLLRMIDAGNIGTAEQAEKAAFKQQKIREAMVAFFNKHDYLVIPISPAATPEKVDWCGQLENDLLRLNAPASLTFLPAMILPFSCGDNRHSAIQIIINPRKTHRCTEIIESLKDFYQNSEYTAS